jgi:hypothetical protein
LKILEESSFAAKNLFYFVFVLTGGGSSGYKNNILGITFMEKRMGNTPTRKYWDSTLKPGYDRLLVLPNSFLWFHVVCSAYMKKWL